MISSENGILLIFLYFVATFLITRGVKLLAGSKLEYLVGNRNVPTWAASLSFASTWIWAPALFVAAQQAYVNGWVGLFWFTVPNTLTLVLFAYFAQWMRNKYPEGFTFSGYIREKFSKRTHNLFLIENFGLQIMSLAVQLLAGAAILYKIAGLPFFWTTVLLAAIPLTYTLSKGIKASIITDFWQMLWIVGVLIIGLPLLIYNSGGFETMMDGLQGQAGDINGLFSGRGLMVTLTFGLPIIFAHLSGPVGDQMFWQRVFSVRQKDVKKSMLIAAGMFVIVPITLGSFGFIAVGSGIAVPDVQLTNAETVASFAPDWFMYIFIVMILCGLLSTVDSIICAVSSLAGHDLYNRFAVLRKFSNVKLAQVFMVIVVSMAIFIANTGVQIISLMLIFGTLRASVMLPSFFAIKGLKVTERGLFWGILLAMIIGFPVFSIGHLSSNAFMIVTGSLLTILLSGILSLTLKDKK